MQNESTVKGRGILEMIRLSTIPRWTIVEVYPPQTVASHSYRVWALATDLYKYMFPVEHNTFERMNVGDLAMLHDVEERWTGDMPTPLKDALEKIHPGICEQLTAQVLNDNLPSLAGFMRGVKGSVPWHVVKIADTVEAYLYLGEYAVNPTRAIEVKAYLLRKLGERLANGQKAFKSVSWDRAREWCRQALDFPPHNSWIDQDIGALYGQAEPKDTQRVSIGKIPEADGPTPSGSQESQAPTRTAT